MLVQKNQFQRNLEKTRTAQIVAAWRSRLDEAEDVMRQLRQSRDEEMKTLLSKLLFFEGTLRREQKHIITEMDEKDRIIENLRKIIHQLQLENKELRDTVNDNKDCLYDESNVKKGLIKSDRKPKAQSKSDKATTQRPRRVHRRGRSKSELDLHLLEKLDEVSNSDEESAVNKTSNDEHSNAGMHTRIPGSLNRITSYSDENIHQSTMDTLPNDEPECNGSLDLQGKYDELLSRVADHFIETPVTERTQRCTPKNSDLFAEIMEELQDEYACEELEELRDTVGELYSGSNAIQKSDIFGPGKHSSMNVNGLLYRNNHNSGSKFVAD